MTGLFAHFRRWAVTGLTALALAAAPGAAQAQGLNILAPLSVGAAMDGGVAELGKNVAYGVGDRLKLDVYAPQNPKGPAPVVFFIYGGSWNSGSKDHYPFVGHAFAASGFVTVIADYRVYPDTGYPGFLEDLAAALKWTESNIARYGGDPERLFLVGHSAGAYNAVMLALDHSFLHDQGVSVPVRAVAGISGPYDFYPFEYGVVSDVFGKVDNPEGTQPVNLVTADAPPMYLVSGTSDPIVRPVNTQTLAQRLRDAGRVVDERYYEGLGHMEPIISLGAAWRWRAPILNDIVSFFRKHGANGLTPQFANATPSPTDAAGTVSTTSGPSASGGDQAAIDQSADDWMVPPGAAMPPGEHPAKLVLTPNL